MNTILVIEDNIEIRENISEILELKGYKVLCAVNGQEGYGLALKHSPDLIVCDILMPVTDGRALFKLVKENEATKNIPLIFLSAGSVPVEVRKGLINGADEYLSKPFSADDLLGMVNKHLPAPVKVL
jgi:CheY-like chemotaxis protein